MQRIVHGNYADPNSTRDIIGITPEEFAVIIDALQNFHNTMQMIYSMDPGDRNLFIKNSLQAGFFDGGGSISVNEVEAAINERSEAIASNYALSYKILEAINKPYPGADYS